MDEKQKTGQRIKELRGKMTQEALGEIIQVHRNSLGSYESGRSEPDAYVIRELSKHFNISADYILGLTDVKSPDISIQGICKYTGLSENAIDLLNLHSIYQKKLKENNSDFLEILPAIIEKTTSYTIATLLNNLIISQYNLQRLFSVFNRSIRWFYTSSNLEQHIPEDLLNLDSNNITKTFNNLEIVYLRFKTRNFKTKNNTHLENLTTEINGLYTTIEEAYNEFKLSQIEIYEKGLQIIKEIIEENIKKLEEKELENEEI